jgi:hypothetical protein
VSTYLINFLISLSLEQIQLCRDWQENGCESIPEGVLDLLEACIKKHNRGLQYSSHKEMSALEGFAKLLHGEDDL